MFDKKIFTIAFFFLQLLQLSGEETASYYYIYLKDKTASTYSIDRPLEFLSQKAIERRLKNKIDLNETDLPINSNYIKIINETCNCQILNTSKWLNAVEISAIDTQNINKIRALNFVQAIKYLGTIKQSKIASIAPLDSAYYNYFNTPKIPYKQQLKPDDYGQAFTQNNQLNLLPLHNSQFRGQGITVAIIDAGFLNVYKTPGMYFNLNTLVVHDFVAHDNSVWEDDRHGANCLSFMKTNDPGTYIGSAPLATYILLRSEEAATEYPTEEVNWISAAEFADSCGVDLISSSLGYNTFNESALNHTHADLNGTTSIIAKAANIARLKGIYVVVSAGNEGKSAWHKIGTPSDAIGALTIGATDGDGYHADFSSFGPSADLRVKPDFVAMGKKAIVASKGGTYAGNGTSYSTPLFAGALACLMQACPNNTYEEIKQALIKSATHQAMPDSAYGYGMPDFALAAMFLGNYLGLDTSKDIFWENSIPTTFQNQNIYFRSGSNQTIEIKITGTRKKKTKQLIAKKIMLKNGEWLNNDELFLILNNGKKLKKRKRLNTLSFELVTSTATYQRVFKLAK
ncbi:MAG: S8 family serine peptidase [bacterium]|nr:S8 family serine peptidase [bacterium]